MNTCWMRVPRPGVDFKFFHPRVGMAIFFSTLGPVFQAFFSGEPVGCRTPERLDVGCSLWSFLRGAGLDPTRSQGLYKRFVDRDFVGPTFLKKTQLEDQVDLPCKGGKTALMLASTLGREAVVQAT